MDRMVKKPFFIGRGIDLLVLGPILLAVFGVGIFEKENFHAFQEKMKNVAMRAALLRASVISNRLSSGLLDLGTIVSLFPGGERPFTSPDTATQRTIRIFLSIHPGLTYLEIFDPLNGKRLWSVGRRTVLTPTFVRSGTLPISTLFSNPHFLVGKSRFSRRLGTTLLQISYLPAPKEERVGFQIDLNVQDLLKGLPLDRWSYALWDLRTGDALAVSPDNLPPTEGRSGSRRFVQVPVPKTPFAIRVGWHPSSLFERWIKKSKGRWGLEEGGVFFLLLMGWGIRALVRRQDIQGKEIFELSSLNESFYDSSGAVGFVIDRSGTILRLTRTGQEILGVSLSEVRETPFIWERFLPPDISRSIHGVFEGQKELPVPLRFECPLILPGREQRIFDWTGTLIRDRGGLPLYLVTWGFDVTERRALERSLQEKNLYLERLMTFDLLRANVAEAVSDATDDEGIMKKFCGLAMEVPGIRLVWVGRPDEKGIFQMMGIAGETAYLEGISISVRADILEGQGPGGKCWREGGPIYISSFETSETMKPWRARARMFGLAACATLPVSRNGRGWGVFTVYLDHEEPFDPALGLLLESIAKSLSLALDRIDLAEAERRATSLKESLLSNTTAGISLVRYPERIIEEANRGFLKILGVDQAESIMGRPAQSFFSWGEENVDLSRKAVERVLREGRTLLRDFRMIKSDGQERYVDIEGHLVSEGEKTVVWTLIDVTERHRLSQDIIRLSDFNALLAQVNQAIAEARDEPGLMQAICDLAVQYGKFGLAWIGIPEEDLHVKVVAKSGATAFLDGLEISLDPPHSPSRGAVGEVWRSGRPIFNYDLLSSLAGTPEADRAKEHALMNEAALPVVRKGRTWGFLTLYLGKPGTFDVPLQEVLVEIARDVSRGLDRLEFLRNERENAAFQKVLLRSTLAGIFLLEHRQIRYANDRLLQMFGYDRAEDLVGQSTRVLYPDSEEYERVGFAYSLLSSKDIVSIPDVSMVKKDGSSVMVDLSITRFPDSDWVVATLYDVTERHAQVEKLWLLSSYNTLLARVSELLSSGSDEAALFQSICDAIIQFGGMAAAAVRRPGNEGEVLMLGASGEVGFFHGVPLEAPEVAGQSVSDRLVRDLSLVKVRDLSSEDDALAKNARRYGIRSGAYLPIARNGKIWAILDLGSKKGDGFDNPVLEGFLVELVRSLSDGLDRMDLVSHQILLSKAVEAVGEGVVITDPDGKVVFVNGGFTSVTGYPEEEILGKNCRLLQGPETDPTTVEAIRGAVREGRSFQGQVLNYRKDGSEFWNLLSISPVRDLSGKIVEFVGNQRDITAMVNLTRQLEYESRHDRLTGLPNRRALDRELLKAIARSARYHWSLAVVILDLDAFKPVNDRFGHEAGDRVLRLLGDRINRFLRKTDFIARLGGDEFVLVIENFNGPPELEDLLARIDQGLRNPIELAEGESVSVGVSMGVALYDPQESQENPDLLLRRADQALYLSKGHKEDRSRSWIIQGEPLPLILSRPQKLLADGMVEVYFQPVLDNHSGRISGVEALARLREPSGGILLPDAFLPDLSEKDLFELSRQVLAQCLSVLPSLQELVPGLWVSVNIDPRSVSKKCLDSCKAMMKESGIHPSHLVLEILEGHEFGETVLAIEYLQQIKKMGVHLALDDIGSAYSSLLRLKEIPVDKVKLGQGFIRTLDKRPKDLHFVEAVLELSHRMGLRLAVEEVESLEIADAIRLLGVDELQGYAISRPLPLASLKKFLRSHLPERKDTPSTLFGLYAAMMRLHGLTRNVLLNSPYVFDPEMLADERRCPLRPGMSTLEISDGSEIVRIHARYHEELGRLIQNIPKDRAIVESDLAGADRLMEEFAEAILREETLRKGSRAKRRKTV